MGEVWIRGSEVWTPNFNTHTHIHAETKEIGEGEKLGNIHTEERGSFDQKKKKKREGAHTESERGKVASLFSILFSSSLFFPFSIVSDSTLFFIMVASLFSYWSNAAKIVFVAG